MSLGVLIDLQRIEIFQLIEPEQAVLPQLRVVDRAFVQHQLAADDLIAGNGVARELDARDKELLTFVDVDVHRNGLLLFVVSDLGNGAEIDVAQDPISLLQVVQALADLGCAEPFAVFDGEGGAQGLRVVDLLVARERNGAQAVAFPLFDRHRDVDALAVVRPECEPVEAALIANLGLRLLHCGARIALVAVGLPHPLRILLELRGVVGLGEKVL